MESGLDGIKWKASTERAVAKTYIEWRPKEPRAHYGIYTFFDRSDGRLTSALFVSKAGLSQEEEQSEIERIRKRLCGASKDESWILLETIPAQTPEHAKKKVVPFQRDP